MNITQHWWQKYQFHQLYHGREGHQININMVTKNLNPNKTNNNNNNDKKNIILSSRKEMRNLRIKKAQTSSTPSLCRARRNYCYKYCYNSTAYHPELWGKKVCNVEAVLVSKAWNQQLCFQIRGITSPHKKSDVYASNLFSF